MAHSQVRATRDSVGDDRLDEAERACPAGKIHIDRSSFADASLSKSRNPWLGSTYLSAAAEARSAFTATSTG
jgi:hypothetical protein